MAKNSNDLCFSNRLDLIDLEYLGNDISVGYDEYGLLTIVKDRSDLSGYDIRLDSEVLSNLVEYLIAHDLLEIIPTKR